MSSRKDFNQNNPRKKKGEESDDNKNDNSDDGPSLEIDQTFNEKVSKRSKKEERDPENQQNELLQLVQTIQNHPHFIKLDFEIRQLWQSFDLLRSGEYYGVKEMKELLEMGVTKDNILKQHKELNDRKPAFKSFSDVHGHKKDRGMSIDR